MRPPRRHRHADTHRDGNEDPLIALAEQLGGRFRPGPPLDGGCGPAGTGCRSRSNAPSVRARRTSTPRFRSGLSPGARCTTRPGTSGAMRRTSCARWARGLRHEAAQVARGADLPSLGHHDQARPQVCRLPRLPRAKYSECFTSRKLPCRSLAGESPPRDSNDSSLPLAR
jgi:hypothetical protein